MLICILRHGETDWNNEKRFQGRENIPLNEAGIEQAKEAAKYLARYDWKAIISSPLSRAKTTAEIISKECGNVEIHEDADLIERDYGKLSGTVSSEREKYFPDEKTAGVEPFDLLQKRTIGALMKNIEKYEGNNIIIASHGAVINSILTYLNDNNEEIRKTRIKNAGMTMLEKTGGEIKIKFFNKTAEELNKQ